jgi:prepilin-type N-terminal cleavage/methylation domain-containing protein
MLKNKGFTMIEVLVAVGVMALISTVIAQVFFTSVRSNIKTELMKEIKQNGDYAMNTMIRVIQNAKSIDVCNANSLTVTNQDTPPTTTQFSYALGHNGNPPLNLDYCYITMITSSQIALTSNNVTIGSDATNCGSAINFICSSIGSVTRAVNIKFTLNQIGAGNAKYEKATIPYDATVVLRNLKY